MQTKHKIIFLSVLTFANILLYLTPFTKSAEVRNFDLSVFSQKTAFGGWRLVQDIGPMEKEIAALPGSEIIRKVYRNPAGEEVQMVIVANSFRGSIHSPTDCLPAQGWVIDSMKVARADIAGDAVPVNTISSHLRHQKGVEHSLVWYWYAVYGGNYSSHFSAVLHNAVQRALFGRKYHWALVRLSTSVTGKNDEQASTILGGFLREVYPAVKQSKDSI
jgi:EpsI family protein